MSVGGDDSVSDGTKMLIACWGSTLSSFEKLGKNKGLTGCWRFEKKIEEISNRTGVDLEGATWW